MKFILFSNSFILCLLIPIGHASSCLPVEQRLDCHPEPDGTQEKCKLRNCCWEILESNPAPDCSYPENFGGYNTVNVSKTNNGIIAFLNRTFPSPYPNDVLLLTLETFVLTDSILRIKISDAYNQRFEAPYPKIETFNATGVEPKYQVALDNSLSGFTVKRENGVEIFNSLGLGAFTFADKFIEISTRLADSARVFGIGEHRTSLKLSLDWQRFTLFNHDMIPSENNNLYGSHPFYIATDSSGSSYGVFLHNSNAMEMVLTPQPALTIRTIGGILDLYFFMGPTPENVVQQYTSVVGRSLLPPYWGLGFHLSKFGYGSANGTRDTWLRNRQHEFPYDGQWNDIDYMRNYDDFTINPDGYSELPDFVNELHDAKMFYVPIVDPGVNALEPQGTYLPYDLAVEMDILVKNKSGLPLIGLLWHPNATAYPDYTHPNIQTYWDTLMSNFHRLVPFDGIWLDANEISQFVAGSLDGCPQDDLENPPYTPPMVGGTLSFGTMCMNARTAAGLMYNVHNVYSIAQTHVTHTALRNLGKRPFIITRSTFSGSGKYAGHWSGDIESSWADLKKSVQELLTFNMYGVSLMGSDICGFRGDTNTELCNRWHQLGAFYTFSRNHNGIFQLDQDPASFDEVTRTSIRTALFNRYFLLPYLYTLFYFSHVHGNTVARPLFFEFPNDPKAYDVELAFMWGSALYIVPVLDEGATSVQAYLPAGRWFDFNKGFEILSSGQNVVLDAPYDTIPLLVKGGSIIPNQGVSVTTTESRENGIALYITLDEVGKASGSLYWDDGVSIDPIENEVYILAKYSLTNQTLMGTVLHNTTGISFLPGIGTISILGVDFKTVHGVLIDDQPVYYGFVNYMLAIVEINIPIHRNFTLKWF